MWTADCPISSNLLEKGVRHDNCHSNYAVKQSKILRISFVRPDPPQLLRL